jgi:hypothetical protein
MKTLSALGVLAGGFLIQPSPKAVASKLLWLVSLVATWRNEDA